MIKKSILVSIREIRSGRRQQYSQRVLMVLCGITLLAVSLSCNLLTAATGPDSEPTGTATLTLAASPTSPPASATETVTPAATQTSELAPSPTATTGPQCTVLQDLNFRSGPGLAYRPPVRALPANTRLIPLAFNPTVIPGGPWVQVREEGGDEIGWVSAGEQFVSCNIDLTSLPSVNVAPPPPPAPPRADNSTPEGDFREDLLVFEDDFNSQYFLRIRVYDKTVGDKDGEGIESVTFTLRDVDGNLVYERTEQTAGYCIFGGGEPTCNPWLLEDYIFKWSPGGEPVQEGNYELRVVVVTTGGEEGNWAYDVELDLPY